MELNVRGGKINQCDVNICFNFISMTLIEHSDNNIKRNYKLDDKITYLN